MHEVFLVPTEINTALSTHVIYVNERADSFTVSIIIILLLLIMMRAF